MSSRSFVQGDVVEVMGNNKYKNKVGMIVDKTKKMYYVKFLDGYQTWFSPNSLYKVHDPVVLAQFRNKDEKRKTKESRSNLTQQFPDLDAAIDELAEQISKVGLQLATQVIVDELHERAGLDWKWKEIIWKSIKNETT